MLDYIYQWIENIAFYMIIIVAVLQMCPGNSYKKYIRFFAGLILIIMLIGPIFKIFGLSNYYKNEYQNHMNEIEEILEKEIGGGEENW